jgi:hypothetical protein
MSHYYDDNYGHYNADSFDDAAEMRDFYNHASAVTARCFSAGTTPSATAVPMPKRGATAIKGGMLDIF